MPGSTMHIMFAKMINPNGNTRYFTGSIALDAIDNYEIKNKNHFRHTDRMIEKIAEFARSLPKDDFNDGLVTHLYLDWRWDMCEVERFAQLHGGDWFHDYRAELSKIGHYYAHKESGIEEIWNNIFNQPQSDYGVVPLATTDDVHQFIESAYLSQREVRDFPELFNPEEVDLFLKMCAIEFNHFKNKYL